MFGQNSPAIDQEVTARAMKGEQEAAEFDVWRKYSVIKGEVPRFHYTDPIGLKLIEEQV